MTPLKTIFQGRKSLFGTRAGTKWCCPNTLRESEVTGEEEALEIMCSEDPLQLPFCSMVNTTTNIVASSQKPIFVFVKGRTKREWAERQSSVQRAGNPQFSPDCGDIKSSALEGLLQEPSVGSKLGHSDNGCESFGLSDASTAEWWCSGNNYKTGKIGGSHWLGPDCMIYMGYLLCIWAARQGNVFAVSSGVVHWDECCGHTPAFDRASTS